MENKNIKRFVDQNRLIDLVYAASFIDGEGYVGFYTTNKANSRGKKYNTKTVKIEITNTDFDILRSIHKFFDCGYIYEDKRRKTQRGVECKPIARWIAQQFQVYNLFKEILPYMRQKEKIKKAKDIINWYEKENKQAHLRIAEFKNNRPDLYCSN